MVFQVVTDSAGTRELELGEGAGSATGNSYCLFQRILLKKGLAIMQWASSNTNTLGTRNR